jgi:acyl-CoA reductase-like NAD-dependent aldehyde dehydrogenase
MTPKFRKVAALSLQGVPTWSKRRQKAVASWLRRQATLLERHPEQIASRFRAGYHAQVQ